MIRVRGGDNGDAGVVAILQYLNLGLKKFSVDCTRVIHKGSVGQIARGRCYDWGRHFLTD